MIKKLLLFLILGWPLFGAEVKLAKVVVEPQNNAEHDLLLHIDESGAATFIRKNTSSETRYSSASLRTGNVVLAKVKGKDVISMSSPNYDEASGGLIHVKYLHNALTMSYQAITLQLLKEGEGWALYTTTPEKKRVHTLTLKPRRFAGILIGIQTIDF